jgi:transposase
MDDQEFMDPTKLVFIDECSVNTGMTRLYGRAEKGERVVDHAPEKNETQTIISSVRLSGETVPLVLDKALNKESLIVYLEKCLIPTLKDGDIITWDNLSSHTAKGIKELIEGCRIKVKLKYLPRYSPELNPIEEMWSKVKSYLKKVKARTLDTLLDAIRDALDLVTTKDISGWFEHSGY